MITTDPTEATLLAAVCAAPADDEPRLAYAAWVEANAGVEGAARADHIRRTARLYRDQHQLDNATTVRLLTPARRATWSNGVDRLGLVHYDYVRGFVAGVLGDAATLLAGDLAARCPVQCVAVCAGAKAELAGLLAAPWLPQLVSLDLGRNDLTDADVQTLLASDLRGLRWLNLTGNPLGFAAVEALAAATIAGKLPALHSLLVSFEIYDEFEGDAHVFRPERGAQLRATYGDLPWLTPRQPGGPLYA